MATAAFPPNVNENLRALYKKRWKRPKKSKPGDKKFGITKHNWNNHENRSNHKEPTMTLAKNLI